MTTIKRTKRGFTITRPVCPVCQEPIMGFEFACGHAFELVQDLRTEKRTVANFFAKDDVEAWAKGAEAFDNLRSRNITTPYYVRQKGTDRLIADPAEEVSK